MLEHSPARLVAHRVQILAILYCVDLLDQVFKDISNIYICECACFHEEQFVFPCVIRRKLPSNLPLTRMLLCQIKLIADEHDNYFGFGVLAHLLNPLLNGHEALLFRDIVDYQRSNWLSIVSIAREGKSLMKDVGLRTYADVMALKRSWPAVSQIWALTVPPAFSVTPLVANSTPMVGYLFFGSSFLIYRLKRCVFPTPVSPTKMTIKPSIDRQTLKSSSYQQICWDHIIGETLNSPWERNLLTKISYLRLKRKLKLSSCLVFMAIFSCLNFWFLFFNKADWCNYSLFFPFFPFLLIFALQNINIIIWKLF